MSAITQIAKRLLVGAAIISLAAHPVLGKLKFVEKIDKAFFPLVVGLGGNSLAPATSYGNAGGTGDRTASITVTTSIPLTAGTGGTINNLVDGAFANNGTDSINPDSLTAQRNAQILNYIKIDFGASTFKRIDEIKWYQDTGVDNHEWHMSASNNGVDWVDLATMSTFGSIGTTNTYSWTNTGSYRYYMLWNLLNATEVGSLASTGRWYQEIEFKISAGGSGTTVPTNVPSYANEYGFGARTGIITATTTAALSSGTASNWVNGLGSADATGANFFTAGQSSKSMNFAFSAARRVTGMRWYQDTTQNHGTWDVKGNNGGGDTTLASGITLGGASMTEYLWSNANTYTNYKFDQVSGTTSSSPWLLEAIFKVSVT